MNHTLVSIALCTYNGQKFLKKQIDSLLSQSHTNLQIIVCDDASTDDTKSILDSYTDPRLQKIFNTQNIGYVKNFQQAIHLCDGAFIALSDQDDVWKAGKIETMLNNIDDALLLFSDSELIDENDNYIGRKISDLRKLYNYKILPGYVWSNCVWGHSIFMKRDLIDHALPVPEGAKHDIWLGFTAACLGKIKYLPEPLTLYRQHAATETTTLPVKATSRTYAKRYQDYIEKLKWIECMKSFVPNPETDFFNELFSLYRNLENGDRIKLFEFLLRNRKKIFSFKKKSYFSQLNEIRKICRPVYALQQERNINIIV
ncbi:MAG: glycosyltransferase family 2 protein [Ginsengibacter sp.]